MIPLAVNDPLPSSSENFMANTERTHAEMPFEFPPVSTDEEATHALLRAIGLSRRRIGDKATRRFLNEVIVVLSWMEWAGFSEETPKP